VPESPELRSLIATASRQPRIDACDARVFGAAPVRHELFQHHFYRRFVEAHSIVHDTADHETHTYIAMIAERFGLDLCAFWRENLQLCERIVELAKALQRYEEVARHPLAPEISNGLVHPLGLEAVAIKACDDLNPSLYEAWTRMLPLSLNLPFLARPRHDLRSTV